jgi:ribonucleoside-diphosphate reductase alpha chain
MVMANKDKINTTLIYDNDFTYDYFGFKTLERAYLMRINGKIVERPQHLLMRVALAIHKDDLKDALKSYKMMSEGYFTHATPTLFNMGTQREQASSCFLLTVDEDSVDGIYKTLSDCAKISKYAGGIGIAFHKIRSKNSNIRGTNGHSNGIVPMFKVFNETARYINQCFTPDTIVYTKNGIKKMKEVTCDDYLLTKDSSYKKVLGISVNTINKEILKIRAKYSFEDVNVTPEHNLFVIQGQPKITNYKFIKRKLIDKIIEPKFILAKDLTENDMFGYPIPSFENDILEYDSDYCRFYGIMIGDGHICVRSENSNEYGISMNLQSKIDTVNFVKRYLESKNIHYWICEDNNKNTYNIRWSSQEINIPYNLLYDNNKNKFIHESFINLPKEKTLSLFKGLIETDGGFTNEIQFYNTSYQVVMTCRYLLLRLGVLSSGHIRNNIGKGHYITRRNGKQDYIENKKISYVLRIPKDKALISIFGDNVKYSNTLGYFKHENIIWSRIRSINKYNYEGDVYDFNISDNHNYTVASLGIVHNSGKRNGSIATYLETWHADIEDFLKMKLNTGIEEERARDLFYAVWISDLFMRRVEADADWSLMCPDKCPNLFLTYGKEFEDLYEKYEREGRSNKVVKARVIWEAILTAQMETGTPYIGFKDAVNIKNNQKNLGTIQCSNLCHEICEYTSRDEIAVCNLASVALPKYIDYTKEICKDTGKEINVPYFNFEKMREIVKQIVKNLNKIIDYNFYPVKEAEYSNRRNRPEGIGISGLSNIFAMMKIAFDSEEARSLNREIFENLYYASLEASMEIARKRKKYVQEYKRIIKLGGSSGTSGTGELSDEDKARLEELKTTYFIIDDELKLPNQYAGAYSTFVGSPLSEGKFQFDLWNVEPSETMKPQWEALRADIQKHGVRNSLLIALMPTASTSQILGWNECIEPFTNNIYTRRTLAGTFVVINKDLISDLLELGIWNQALKDKIILADGSVQEIAEIPQPIRDRYKTVWELKQKAIIDLAADRAPFVCQTQSMNLFVKNPTYKTLSAMHFYSWKKGLKTGIYYLRSQAKSSAQKFSVDLEKVGSGSGSGNSSNSKDNSKDNSKEINNKEEPKKNIEVKEEPECIMCSS